VSCVSVTNYVRRIVDLTPVLGCPVKCSSQERYILGATNDFRDVNFTATTHRYSRSATILGLRSITSALGLCYNHREKKVIMPSNMSPIQYLGINTGPEDRSYSITILQLNLPNFLSTSSQTHYAIHYHTRCCSPLSRRTCHGVAPTRCLLPSRPSGSDQLCSGQIKVVLLWKMLHRQRYHGFCVCKYHCPLVIYEY
jgi:hypothetical protein